MDRNKLSSLGKIMYITLNVLSLHLAVSTNMAGFWCFSRKDGLSLSYESTDSSPDV